MTKVKSGATSRLFRHLRLAGLPSQAANKITSQINLWLQRSGEQWTIDRLKAMKQFIIQKEANGFASPPQWVSMRKDGAFKGCFAAISKLPLVNQLAVLNSYTCIRFKVMSDLQRFKALASITRKSSSDDMCNISRDLFSCKRLLRHPSVKGIRRQSLHWVLHHGIHGNPLTLKPGGLISANPTTFWGDNWISSFMDGVTQPLVGEYLHKRFGVPLAGASPEDDMFADSPGEITCIQERGGKARVIAMPNAALQTALRPLHELLSDLNRSLPTDCTFDQEQGAIFAKDSLSRGKTVHSVDLSSATDRFPLKLQLDVLKMLGLEDESKLIEHVCSSSWYVSPKAFNVEDHQYIKYGAGQPMGLYGSFSLFALTHNLMLSSICLKLDHDPKDTFRVLGDDVIINDDRVAALYRYLLKELDVPVSESKSLVSEYVAEFAGYVITHDGFVKPPKVASTDMTNFESHLRVFGLDAVKELPARLRKQAREFLQAPEALGGLGLNPEGLSLDKRIPHGIFEPKETSIPEYSSFYPQLLEMREMVDGTEYEDVVTFLYDQYEKYGPSKYDKDLGPLHILVTKAEGNYREIASNYLSQLAGKPLHQRYNTFNEKRVDQSVSTSYSNQKHWSSPSDDSEQVSLVKAHAQTTTIDSIVDGMMFDPSPAISKYSNSFKGTLSEPEKETRPKSNSENMITEQNKPIDLGSKGIINDGMIL